MSKKLDSIKLIKKDVAPTIDATLAERGNRYNLHGTYADHAHLTQSMKDCVREHKGWQYVPDDMREAIDMILHKIARVVNGNPHYKDNWVDIEGYAKLVSRELIEESTS